jgi:hypothetical protein
MIQSRESTSNDVSLTAPPVKRSADMRGATAGAAETSHQFRPSNIFYQNQGAFVRLSAVTLQEYRPIPLRRAFLRLWIAGP